MRLAHARRQRGGIALLAAFGLLLSTLPARVAATPEGPLIATGQLRDESGRPLAGNVGVWYLDPARGQLVLAGSTTTAADGRFALHVTALGALRRLAAQNDGWLNLLLAGGSTSRRATVGISRSLSDGAWTGRTGSIAVDLRASDPVPGEARSSIEQFAARARSAAPPGARVEAQAIAPCLPDLVDTWTGYVVVGEVHTWTDHTATWTYGRTADSDIGIGISYDGSAWRQSGSFHVGTSSTSSVTKKAGSRYGRLLKSRFEFAKYRWTGYCPFLPSYTITPTRWLSGLVEGASVRNFDGYCGSYYAAYATEFGADTEWTREDSDYARFGAAVSAFGLVTLSAQSGMSSNVRMTHTFGSASNHHRLCGKDNDILRAKRVFAG